MTRGLWFSTPAFWLSPNGRAVECTEATNTASTGTTKKASFRWDGRVLRSLSFMLLRTVLAAGTQFSAVFIVVRWLILPRRIVTFPSDDRHLPFAPLDLGRYLEFDVAEVAVSFAVERRVAEAVTATEA